jgi:hypothetical protein
VRRTESVSDKIQQDDDERVGEKDNRLRTSNNVKGFESVLYQARTMSRNTLHRAYPRILRLGALNGI